MFFKEAVLGRKQGAGRLIDFPKKAFLFPMGSLKGFLSLFYGFFRPFKGFYQAVVTAF